MARTIAKTKPNRRPLKIASLVIAIVLVLGASSYFLYRHFHKSTASPTTVTTSTGAKVNYTPPTPAEQQITEDQKTKNQTQPTTTPATTSDGKRAVTPTIASADQNGVSAYITGIFEDNGTCTATFTHNDDKITVTSQGFQNSNYTSCAPLNLSSPLNIKGTWSVVVSYSSANSSGASAAASVQVN